MATERLLSLGRHSDLILWHDGGEGCKDRGARLVKWGWRWRARPVCLLAGLYETGAGGATIQPRYHSRARRSAGHGKSAVEVEVAMFREREAEMSMGDLLYVPSEGIDAMSKSVSGSTSYRYAPTRARTCVSSLPWTVTAFGWT